MTSEKQTAANIENAQHSTGPRTPEGKATSSLNGLKHGLTGVMHLLPDEDRAEYADHCEGIVVSLDPATDLELHLAQAIADDYWRIQRLRCLLQKLFTDSDSFGIDPDPKKIATYSIYESRLTRNIKTNNAELRQHQADRREREFHESQNAAEEAMRAGLTDMQAEAARMDEAFSADPVLAVANRLDNANLVPTQGMNSAKPLANGFGYSTNSLPASEAARRSHLDSVLDQAMGVGPARRGSKAA